MKIKDSRKRSFFFASLRRLFDRLTRPLRFLAVAALSLIVLLVVVLSSVYYGIDMHKNGDAGSLRDVFSHLARTRLSVVGNYLQGLSAHPEHLRMDIKFKNFQKLVYDREVAMENQVMISEAGDFVPAEISLGDKTARAGIRLKGDWTWDNLQGRKWSYRVKLKGDNTLMGMKQFSLHHPRVRNYVYEWLFHKALEREDVIPLRYRFVRLSINGDDLGIYALEEHFEKRLIEHSRRREGPIIKFNENLMWADVRQNWPRILEETGFQSIYAADIDVFKSNSILADSNLSRQFRMGHDLLDDFRNGRLPVSDVFDIDKMAVQYALGDLLGATHGLAWHNVRFYYNPVTSRLEPIGFDGNAGTPITTITGAITSRTDPFRRRLLADLDFMRAYVRRLAEFSRREYIDSLLEAVNTDLHDQLAIIYSEFPYFDYSPELLYQNQRIIQTFLNPPGGIQAYIRGIGDGKVQLDMANIQPLPIEVLALSCPGLDSPPPNTPYVLPPRASDQRAVFQPVRFALPRDVVLSDSLLGLLTVAYRLPGLSRIDSGTVFRWPVNSPEFREHDLMRRPPNARDFPFVRVDETGKALYLKPGTWTVRDAVVFPSGYRVYGSGGITLDLRDKGMILSYSPLE
ncbi:MAG: CotH kinase family protein, partial [candidate division Zixibacteria bacterium]|nr:CotH kinase family protein [candidate division Zixibacteria bacterium]